MMSDCTVLEKGSSRRMKITVKSPAQARRLSIALQSLQHTPLEELKQRKMIRKLRVEGRDDVYTLRVGPKERIIFSPTDNKIFIHDIVFLNSQNSVISLIK